MSELPEGALFNRAYSLTVGAPKQTVAASYGNTTADQAPLRISFEIEKSIASSPNKAKISVYNMAPSTRGAITKGYVVTLSAGYGGSVDLLFSGQVAKAEVTRNGSDIVTEFECMDGGGAITGATLTKSWGDGRPGSVTLVRVLQDLADAMHLTSPMNPEGITAGAVSRIPQATMRRYAVHGPVRHALDELCKTHGLRWSIQNGALNITLADYPDSQTAVVLSPGSGLLGIPSVNAAVLSFSSLLNSQISPGRIIQIVSNSNESANGFYTVRKATYVGDTHESKWSIDGEGIPAPNVAVSNPPGAADGRDFSAGVA